MTTCAEDMPDNIYNATVDSPMESCIGVLDGVREINLREALGEDTSYVEGAWMLNPNICVLQCQSQEFKNNELVLLDTRDCSVISRTLLPQAASLCIRVGKTKDSIYCCYQKT